MELVMGGFSFGQSLKAVFVLQAVLLTSESVRAGRERYLK